MAPLGSGAGVQRGFCAQAWSKDSREGFGTDEASETRAYSAKVDDPVPYISSPGL